jgi:dihydropteroate synthase
MTPLVWEFVGHRFEITTRPLVMGIVNVTPDSFSDGGHFLDPAAAVDHALELEAEGADILDVGGESTRPGSQPVPLDEELRRALPVVRELAKRTAKPISVDTSKAPVAYQCLHEGASIINDVTGLLGDPYMPNVAATSGAGVVVMHMQGTPQTMQANPTYADVVREVGDFFRERLESLTAVGVRREAIALDPGVGFGKAFRHTMAQLANLDAYRDRGRPICLGVSRKGFIGQITGRDRANRMPGSLAVACFAMARGAAQILRVHDVAPTVDAVKMAEAIFGTRA